LPQRWTRMRGLKPTMINTAIHAKLASHFLYLIVPSVDPALRSRCLWLPLYIRGGCKDKGRNGLTLLVPIATSTPSSFPGRRARFFSGGTP
jgi:hypothetical protein